MKRLSLILIAFILAVSVTACATEQTDESASAQQTESAEEITESTSENTEPSDETADEVIEEPTEETAENGDDKINIDFAMAHSPLDSLIQRTEGIIYGEVVAEAEPVHTNPDGTLKSCYGSIEPAMKYQYSVRVDESYLGDIQAGDIIKVNVFNDYMIPYGTDPANVNTNYSNYYLTVGEKYVLFLYFFEGRTAVENPTPETVGYETNGWKNGVFREGEDGVWRPMTARSENAFRIDELPELIAEYRDSE